MFFCVVRHQVISDAITNGRRLVTGGRAVIVNSYVLTNPDDSDMNSAKRDYERVLSEGSSMGLGELRQFIKSIGKRD